MPALRQSVFLLALLVACRRGGDPVDTPVLLDLGPANRADLVDYEPSWSPDGNKLAFISGRLPAQVA